MVKSGAPATNVEKLTQALRTGGEDLLRFRTLNQKSPVRPLQLFTASAVVDPILVTPGERVAVIADDQGLSAVSYAALRPHWEIVNWVPDMKTLLRVQSLHPNTKVHFDKQPHQKKPTGVKAIIAAAWAHQVFSRKHYSLNALARSVAELIAELPEDGKLLIQDVAMDEDANRFVLLDVENYEAAEALVEFSNVARSSLPQAERGFFIETLDAPRAGVMRFRLPYKWAAEFFQRWRLGIAPDAPYEVTTLPLEQWAGMIEQCGGRVLYRAPHTLKKSEAAKYVADMRFLDEREQILPYPPSTFTMVVEKLNDEKAAGIYERRVSKEAPKELRLTADKAAGTIVEIKHQENDVLPWRRDEEGNLRVWIRTHVARPIINTVPRGTPNLDGRQWAGFLIEPITIPAQSVLDEEAVAFAVNEMTRLPLVSIKNVRAGINYYPAPTYLDQRVRGLFVAVTNSLPLQTDTDIVEVLADDVLRAISCGLIPDGKLEILISKLMLDLGIEPTHQGDLLDLEEFEPVKIKAHQQREARTARFMAKSGEKLNEYVAQDSDALRGVRSVFVHDHVGPYGRETRNAAEKDFIIPAALSANTAVCLPLIRNVVGQYVFAAEPQNLPIPARNGQTEPMISLPSFRLPENLKTLDDVAKFMAKHLGVSADDIFPLGPSFFLQPQVSPERIYPFGLRAAGYAVKWERFFKPRNQLQRLIDPNVEKSTAFIEFKAARDLGQFYQGFTADLTAEVTQKANLQKAETLQQMQLSNDNTWQFKPQPK